jgi:TolA-binding protein
MHKFILATLIFTTLAFSGCARIDPLSPNLRQELQNQNGKIEELKNNQNGLMLELGKIRNQNEMNAKEIQDAQQGLLNIKGMQNSGIQFFSGDGGLIVFLGLVMMSFLFIYHYRTRAVKSEKTAEVLAQQITLRDDPDLEDNVFLSVLNTDLEAEVYQVMVKAQEKVRNKV